MNSGRGPKKERGRKMRLFLFFFQRGDFKKLESITWKFSFLQSCKEILLKRPQVKMSHGERQVLKFSWFDLTKTFSSVERA